MCSLIVLIIHIFTFTWGFLGAELVSGGTFTFVNNCTQIIWPAISGNPSLGSTGFELPVGGTRVFQAPKGWMGRFWGRTGCTFNATGQGSCRTGDCGSGQIECNGFDSTAITLAEFSIDRSVDSMDFYDVSLANGFNLPMMIEARNGSGQNCPSTGCTEDVNRLCPAELTAESGDACQNACNVFSASECGSTFYSQLFKNACPLAFSHPKDDAGGLFTCSAGDYVVTFCPDLFSLQNEKCSEPFQCGITSNIDYPFWGANRPEICGFPGFELLNCEEDVPLLKIDSGNYRVLEIHYSSQTLKVARQDLWNSTCPSVLFNTTLDPNLFTFPQNYTYENVTLYYDCTTVQPQATTSSNQSRPSQTNQFTCNADRTERFNFFVSGKAFELGSNVTCNDNISVPVNQSVAQALSNDSASVNDLQDALASGFSIQWLNSIASCQGCVRSGGVCVYDWDLALIKCNIMQRTLVEVPTTGLTPGLSPGPSPSYHTNSEHGKSGPSVVGKILIGVALVATVIVIVAILIVCLRCCKRLRLALYQETNSNIENFLLNNHSDQAPKRYKYSQIKKMTKSFSDMLGQGGHGSVYKGMLPHGQFVAVKLLTETKGDEENFINEVASISKTSHVNIVKLLGFCYAANKRALVYEFMSNKSLDKFIITDGSPNTDCQLDWTTLYKIAVGVARGLEYLHKGCNARIVHFDIKPQNILLDEEFFPKISDFGLAKLYKKKQSILSIAETRGTAGYIAPEVFSRNFGEVSHKSDVYSYGIMILEMAGARNNFGLGSIQSHENTIMDKIYEQVILHETENMEATANEDEEKTIGKMFLVGFWCIQTVPSERPSMSKVVEMLEGSRKSIQIPPKPFLFTPTPSASVNMEAESSIERAGA